MTQSRWKSPVLYITIVIATAGVLGASGLFTSDVTVRIISTVGALLSAILGIINNPTSRDTP
jgi:uncharacterized membrane protein